MEDSRLVQVASEIILELSLELQNDGRPWPHPWDHYPFVTQGEYVWLRYRDLDAEQREQVIGALVRVRRRLRALGVLHGFGQSRQHSIAGAQAGSAESESY
jgi:hypothetical protein